MPKCDKYQAKWKANIAKCSKYHAQCKVTVPKCSKFHAKWQVLVPNCCKYKANGRKPKNNPKLEAKAKAKTTTSLHPLMNVKWPPAPIAVIFTIPVAISCDHVPQNTSCGRSLDSFTAAPPTSPFLLASLRWLCDLAETVVVGVVVSDRRRPKTEILKWKARNLLWQRLGFLEIRTFHTYRNWFG